MPHSPHGWSPAGGVSEQAPDVYFVEGPASNWIVARDQTGFILIDSGYPADRPLVLESIRHLGLNPAGARAVLITHGHVDHTGQRRSSPRHMEHPSCAPPKSWPTSRGRKSTR